MTRSEIMSRIRSKNTKPELEVRRRLRAAGFRGYRLHWGEFHIDVAFVGKKVAIFVDSCWWHQCPKHFRMPKSNLDFWVPKFAYGARRNRHATRTLRRRGWKVYRIWGHDIPKFDPAKVLGRDLGIRGG